ncbi:MAG: rhomboid family intramembrane serine protease, partial [Lacipirellulaceae bacterium]
MIFPYSVDAPLYHLPFATVGLIVANVVLFLCAAFGPIYVDDGWLLEYGTGVHPVQWFTSRFMHADLGHLLGNMFFLWVFGLIVEGKLGWLRFLCVYFAIAIGQAALEQVVMSGYSGVTPGSLGASAGIFGLMVISCIWAPVNNINVLVWFAFLIVFTFEVMVGVFAAFFVGLDITMWLIFGGYAGSSILHLMGGFLGGILGVVMLKRNMVDCEDYDLFSYWSGEYGAEKQKKRQAAKEADPARLAAVQHSKRLEAEKK